VTWADFDAASLPRQWRVFDSSAADEAEKQRLLAELSREVSPGHRLWAVQVNILGVGRHLKDLVCWLPAEERWATVHLTWNKESDARWPSTTVYDRWLDLVEDYLPEP
jgi:hypothetical protein